MCVWCTKYVHVHVCSVNLWVPSRQHRFSFKSPRTVYLLVRKENLYKSWKRVSRPPSRTARPEKRGNLEEGSIRTALGEGYRVSRPREQRFCVHLRGPCYSPNLSHTQDPVPGSEDGGGGGGREGNAISSKASRMVHHYILITSCY